MGMTVQLVSYTPNAVNLLIFTKSTRLQMRPNLLNEIEGWPEEKKREELAYMARTIPSSWEFVDYVFIINDVTRAFTHQFIRNRHGSYAQQTMRVLRVSNLEQPFRYRTGPTIANNPEAMAIYQSTMRTIDQAYNTMIDKGAKEEDARGILPTNICTNICAKFNLRTLAEMQLKRGSHRTQEEYRKVKDLMLQCIYEVHPWAKLFLDQTPSDIVVRLNDLSEKVRAIDPSIGNDLLKEVELLRKEQLHGT